jgi:hypothetical protein
MPKNPPPNNPKYRDVRTVQSAASLLRRISQRAGAVGAVEQPPNPASLLIENVRAQLPEQLRPHLVNCMQKTDELVLYADAAVWAARMKLVLGESAVAAAGTRRVTVRVMAGRLVAK